MSKRFDFPYDLQRTLKDTLPFHVTLEMYLGKFERDNGLMSFRVAAPSEAIIRASVGALNEASTLPSLAGKARNFIQSLYQSTNWRQKVLPLKMVAKKTTCFLWQVQRHQHPAGADFRSGIRLYSSLCHVFSYSYWI